MKFYFRLLLFAAVSLTAGANAIYPCLCAPPAIDVAYDRASHIFLGRVVAKNSDGSFRFEVQKRWKSAPGNAIAVFPNGYRDAHHWTSCDSGFSEGRSFLVFAVGDSNGWVDDSCLTVDLEDEAQSARGRKVMLAWHTNKIPIAASAFLVLTVCIVLFRRLMRKRQSQTML